MRRGLGRPAGKRGCWAQIQAVWPRLALQQAAGHGRIGRGRGAYGRTPGVSCRDRNTSRQENHSLTTLCAVGLHDPVWEPIAKRQLLERHQNELSRNKCTGEPLIVHSPEGSTDEGSTSLSPSSITALNPSIPSISANHQTPMRGPLGGKSRLLRILTKLHVRRTKNNWY